MLSISKPLIGDAAGLYYIELGREDYYLEGGEPPGNWVGGGASTLGLRGKVSKEEFMALFRGFNPETGEALNKNSGQEGRRAGWDLTFSAPKSVSALWAVSDEETRKSIQELHQRAVETALSYVEEGAISRRGKGGAEREPCKLIISTFEHGTSRAQEPNLHTHSVILNIGLRDDGTTGTLETGDIFKRKMAAGAIFRAELAAGLENELGIKVKRERDFFEVEEVSKELCSHWSTRRKEIEESLSEKGLEGSKAAAIAALDTRESKDELTPRAELQEKWKGEAKEYGLSLIHISEPTRPY